MKIIAMSFRKSPRLRNLLFNFENRFLTSFEMTLLIIVFFCNTSFSQDKIDFENCTFKEFSLHGKIKIVDSFPDFTVQIVESFPDLKVKIVNSFPDDCGEWQIVETFPDMKIKIVDSFPDLKIKFVESFPGKP
jgi:hypothetical protein